MILDNAVIGSYLYRKNLPAKGRKGIITFALFVIISSALFGCAGVTNTKETRSEAIIIEKNSAWKIDRRYGHSGERSDRLVNKNMSVELRFFRAKENRFFDVTFNFIKVPNQLIFHPSHIMFKLSNGDILKSKALSCYKPKWDLESLRLYPSEAEPIYIDRVESYPLIGNPCYVLFVDHPAPLVDEDIIMFVGDSFALNGDKLKIPPIHFRKNTHYSVWDELRE